jgi:hypothetical protein
LPGVQLVRREALRFAVRGLARPAGRVLEEGGGPRIRRSDFKPYAQACDENFGTTL